GRGLEHRLARAGGREGELEGRATGPVRDLRERVARRGYVDDDEPRTVACEHARDLRADPARRTRDDGDLARERRGPERLVEHGRLALGGAHREELGVDEGRAWREEGPDGRERRGVRDACAGGAEHRA